MTELVFDKSFTEVYHSCLEVLQKMKLAVTYSDEYSGEVKASSGFSLFSKVHLEINVKDESSQKTRVKIDALSGSFNWINRRIVNAATERDFTTELTRKLGQV